MIWDFLTGEIVRLQLKKKVFPNQTQRSKVMRRATDKDIEVWQQNKDREKEALDTCPRHCPSAEPENEDPEVEIQADGP